MAEGQLLGKQIIHAPIGRSYACKSQGLTGPSKMSPRECRMVILWMIRISPGASLCVMWNLGSSARAANVLHTSTHDNSSLGKCGVWSSLSNEALQQACQHHNEGWQATSCCALAVLGS